MTVARRDILSVQIRPDLKEKLKKFAEAKRWSMSQSAEYLIEQGLADGLETDSGEDADAQALQKKKK